MQVSFADEHGRLVFRRHHIAMPLRLLFVCICVAAAFWALAHGISTPRAFDIIGLCFSPFFTFVLAIFQFIVIFFYEPILGFAVGVLIFKLADAFFPVRYIFDEHGISKGRSVPKQRVQWARVSPFSETEPAHREGDKHCVLKSRGGEALMAVGPHLAGHAGKEMMAEIRRRIGPPALAPDGHPEVFRYGDFGDVPCGEFHLDAETLRVVGENEHIEIRLDEVEEISVETWPNVGEGIERARIAGKGGAVGFDSRLIGFWPLLKHLAAFCPNAKVSDRSRRSQL